MKIAFSTVGCPDLTLEQVVRSAARWGYQGVELRLSPKGVGAGPVASDPMGVSPEALHDLFEDAGVDPVCLSTALRFDEAVWPPVMGHLFADAEVGVADTKAVVEQAAGAGVPFVRVFGHQLPGGEPRAWGLRRVSERLSLAAQTARNTGVRVLIENSGSFASARELRELHDLVASPFLGMSYSVLAAVQAGDCPISEIDGLLSGLRVVKLADTGEDGRPVPLGEGRLPISKLMAKLVAVGYQGWVVYEYPRLWRPELGDTRAELEQAAERLFAWATPARPKAAACGHGCGCAPAV